MMIDKKAGSLFNFKAYRAKYKEDKDGIEKLRSLWNMEHYDCPHQIHIHPILIQLFKPHSPPVALVVHGSGNFQET